MYMPHVPSGAWPRNTSWLGSEGRNDGCWAGIERSSTLELPLATSTIVIADAPSTSESWTIRSPDGDHSPPGSVKVPSERTAEPSTPATKSSY